MVLGCDEKSRGAANWAVGTDNPNIINVAATRAKEEFYIIGNRKLYNSINSEVIYQTNRVLQEFNGIEMHKLVPLLRNIGVFIGDSLILGNKIRSKYRNNMFDVFTSVSIGEVVQTKCELSKGKSLQHI